MALRIWLPLNGNLENKGISDITVTNNGATVDNNGKIGKCYSFNGSSYISINNNYITSNNLSVSFWIYVNNISGNKGIINCRNASSKSFAIYLIGATLRIDTGTNWSTGYNLNAETWYHCVFTCNGNDQKLYINGVLEKSRTSAFDFSTIIPFTSIGSEQTNGGSPRVYFNGKLNDVRIYDHCLSAKEVKEISQGLVLHYKLDGFNGGAGENLLWNSKKLDIASAISNKNCSNRGSSVRQLRTDGFNEVRCSAAWQGLSAWVNQFNLKSGDKLTYSFYVYTNGSNKSLSFYPMMYNSSGTRDTSSKLDISLDGGAYTSVNSKSWGAINNTAPIRHYVTFIWNDTMASILNDGGKIELSIEIHGTFNSGEYGYIFAPKLEYGDKPTAWSPAPEEMGIDTFKITDSSGYGRDGIQNNVTIITESDRYNNSTNFNGTDSYVKIPDNSWMSQGMEALTVNLWAKATTWPTNGGRLISCTETGGFNLEGGSSGYWRFPIHVYTNAEKTSTAYKYDSKEIQISALTPNDWNMITLVYNTTGTKTYINGQLHHTYTNASYGIHFNTNARLFLGCEANTASPGGNYFNGQESDFRLYATALSAEDILDLYHTPANIDNLGGIHGFEFIEKTPNLLNPDLREWAKESNVTCVWNEETKYFDVNTNRDTSNTSRWGIFQDITLKPNTSYLFVVDMMGTGSAMGIVGQDATTISWPNDRNTAGDTKRYYYILTTSATNTKGRAYLNIKPSINQIAHFKNIYLGEVGEIASIKQSGIFENEDMVEYNENGRITKSGELAGSNFIEK